MSEEKQSKWKELFTPPFKYAEDSDGYILDARGNTIIEVRGWGHLSSKFGDKEAAKIQDKMATDIADLLNSESELIRLKEDNERLKEEYENLRKGSDEVEAYLLSRIRELEQQLEQSNVPRWVKAETRLPSDDSIGEIICRVPEIHNGKETGRTFIETRPWFKMSDVSEWLEELPDKRQSPE